MNTIKNFFNDETALELSEYAVGAALIAIAAAAAYKTLGDTIIAKINALVTAMGLAG